MMSLVTSAHEAPKPKVLITESERGGGSAPSSADPLSTPRALLGGYPLSATLDESSARLLMQTLTSSAPSSAQLLLPISTDFPTTAELIPSNGAMTITNETIKRANPFELSFKTANRAIGALSSRSTSNTELLEQSGLIPASSSTSIASTSTSSNGISSAISSLATSEAASSFLSKLTLPTLNHSPAILSNFNLLSADGNENTLKTADFARLVQQMRDSGSISTQNSFMGESSTAGAPKTSDVLNAVLDCMAVQQQQNKERAQYLGASSSLFNMPTPAGSAPNSAGVLAQLAAPNPQSLVSVLASVAHFNNSVGGGGQNSLAPVSLAPPSQGQPSPMGLSPRESKKQLSPKVLHDVSGASMNSVPSMPSSVVTTLAAPTLLSHVAAPQPQASIMTALQQAQAAQQHDPAAWDPHDVKPIVSGSSIVYDHESNGGLMGLHYAGSGSEEMSGPRSNDSGSSSNMNGHHGLGSHGRGRGRSTADMPPDERRQTILERNKAAAVRYRKRKKEEHDDMIARCHQLEHERTTIMSVTAQNAVLRREIDRLNNIIKDREARCHCLRGVPLPPELRDRPPGDLEVLEQCAAYPGLHGAAASAHLLNGLHAFNPSAPKRPALQKM